ncbi:hypothetical protein TREES_T100004007 [Tupaia chinensis]|uniref:Uncharacterized protein n=1 Tax=Tupaia chinensis TaxID=246437 RepID=L9KNT3_TUPCH|nr:hypothetical protein TREES_T100004007 [Tupaia chinensis]
MAPRLGSALRPARLVRERVLLLRKALPVRRDIIPYKDEVSREDALLRPGPCGALGWRVKARAALLSLTPSNPRGGETHGSFGRIGRQQ